MYCTLNLTILRNFITSHCFTCFSHNFQAGSHESAQQSLVYLAQMWTLPAVPNNLNLMWSLVPSMIRWRMMTLQMLSLPVPWRVEPWILVGWIRYNAHYLFYSIRQIIYTTLWMLWFVFHEKDVILVNFFNCSVLNILFLCETMLQLIIHSNLFCVFSNICISVDLVKDDTETDCTHYGLVPTAASTTHINELPAEILRVSLSLFCKCNTIFRALSRIFRYVIWYEQVW